MNEEKKSFDEWWKEEEEAMKISLEASKRWKAERHGKSPAKELVDQIEGREKKDEPRK
tara:strand:- start:104 stop:277 length:174 start_codon:yes stop_codon:yes gene_type:complete